MLFDKRNIFIYTYTYIHIYIYIENEYIYIYYLVDVMTPKKFNNLLYSFEATASIYKRLKKLTSFNNTTLNIKVQKPLAS